MAKQLGHIKLQGTIGDYVFYKMGGEYLVRKKRSPLGRKFYTPKYTHIRESAELFTRAVKANKLFRSAFRPVLMHVNLGNAGVLTKAFRKALTNVDPYEGKLVFEQEDLFWFNELELSVKARFHSSFRATMHTTLDRNSGQFRVNIPEIDHCSIVFPEGATHFQITAAVAAINFEKESTRMEAATSGFLAVHDPSASAICLSAAIPELADAVVFTILVISFYESDAEGGYSNMGNRVNSAIILQASV